MENNMDLTIASIFIWGAVIFVIGFFAWAAWKDLFPKYETRIRDFISARIERTPAPIPKRATYAEAFFENREQNREPIFVPGDYDFRPGLPVYNSLANQYNRKHEA